jgi:hypothetical protein
VSSNLNFICGSLLSKYAKSKETIKAIREQAQKEKGDWHKVINDFNNKFFVPFSLHVSNQVNVMLILLL